MFLVSPLRFQSDIEFGLPLKLLKKVFDDWWYPKVAKLPQLQGCNYKEPPYAEATQSATTKSCSSFGRKVNLIVKASETELCAKTFNWICQERAENWSVFVTEDEVTQYKLKLIFPAVHPLKVSPLHRFAQCHKQQRFYLPSISDVLRKPWKHRRYCCCCRFQRFDVKATTQRENEEAKTIKKTKRIRIYLEGILGTFFHFVLSELFSPTFVCDITVFTELLHCCWGSRETCNQRKAI